MAWSDVDGDELVDVFIGGAAGQPGRLLIAKESGGFAKPQSQPFEAESQSEDMGCLFLDVDSDGDLDLFVVSGGVEAADQDPILRDRLYVNDGVSADGAIAWRLDEDRVPDLRDSGGPVAAADFDRDGDLDLAVGSRVVPGQYPLSSSSRLLVNRDGHFVDETQTWCPDLADAGMVTAALWCDVNNDGWCDLIMACEYGPIRLYVNRDGTLAEQTASAGLDGHLGWWNGLAVCDFDSDGDLDVVATNYGDNTKYHPSDEHPQLIFFSDFDDSGRTCIVEAKSTDAALLPVRGRSCSSNAMPVLRERFESYDSFAKATLEDIYSRSRLNDALQLKATSLKSCLMVNDGTGHFDIQPLPALAQVAPAFGVQFLETGGQYPSVFVAQNFYHAQRETGRMNGGVGVLMTCDSTGQYSAMWPSETGIVVPEDSRSGGCGRRQWRRLAGLSHHDQQRFASLFCSAGQTRKRLVRPLGFSFADLVETRPASERT